MRGSPAGSRSPQGGRAVLCPCRHLRVGSWVASRRRPPQWWPGEAELGSLVEARGIGTLLWTTDHRSRFLGGGGWGAAACLYMDFKGVSQMPPDPEHLVGVASCASSRASSPLTPTHTDTLSPGRSAVLTSSSPPGPMSVTVSAESWASRPPE